MTDAEHEPQPLVRLYRFNRKQGSKTGGRQWNVWYHRLKCPTCGREFTRLANPLRGRLVRCVGRDALRVTKKPADNSEPMRT